MAVEAQIQALVGKLGEEADESVGVVSSRRAETERAAVAQDDVDDSRFDGMPQLLFRGINHLVRLRPLGVADLEQPDLAEIDVGERVADERIQALVVDPDVEDAATAGRHDHCL